MNDDAINQNSRAKQKQMSRDADHDRLTSGQVSAEQLRRDNNFFAALPIKRFKMVAIGNKPLKRSL